jgi:anti-anti-sigma factor
MGLTLCVQPGDCGTIVRVGGEVDVSVSDPLQDLLLRIMRTHSPFLLLDLSGVSFMDCAGVRVLLLSQRRAELRGGSLRLIAASAAVRRIIDLVGMRDIFPVHDRERDVNDDTSSRPEWAGPHRDRSVHWVG